MGEGKTGGRTRGQLELFCQSVCVTHIFCQGIKVTSLLKGLSSSRIRERGRWNEEERKEQEIGAERNLN